jgi:hypothetical protein
MIVLTVGFYARSRTARPSGEPLLVEDRPSQIQSAAPLPQPLKGKHAPEVRAQQQPAVPATLAAAPPAVTAAPPEQTRARSSVREWAVIAATYNGFSAAAKRAASLRGQFRDCACSVFPSEGQGQKYYVLVGSGMARNDADDFRLKAVAAGLPADTYVTKLVPETPDVP